MFNRISQIMNVTIAYILWGSEIYSDFSVVCDHQRVEIAAMHDSSVYSKIIFSPNTKTILLEVSSNTYCNYCGQKSLCLKYFILTVN